MKTFLFSRKLFLISLVLGMSVLFSYPAQAEFLDNSNSFTLAKATKLGRGAGAYSVGHADIGGGSEIITEKECDPLCTSCDKMTGICSKCPSGYLLYENACQPCPANATCSGTSDFSCPIPQYFKMDMKCFKCSDTMQYCTACTSATKCTTCEEGYVVSETGDSCIEAPTCATAAMQSNTNVAAATDAATYYDALNSGKSIILVDENISGVATTDLGSKKLVGPKYFSSIALCSSKTTPTLTFAASAKMTINGGEVNSINLSFPTQDSSVDAVSGSGTIKESTIAAQMVKNVVKATGKITLAGNVTINSIKAENSGYAVQSVLKVNDTSTAQVEITGKTTLKGGSDYGLQIGQGAKATITSSGSLVLNIPNVFVAIDLENNSTFTANGPVKFESEARSAIGYITTGKAVISLNASGNYIKTSYSGLMQTYGDINIKGSTTIECIRGTNTCDTCGCKAIDSHETYSNSVNSVTIDAPVTLVNFNRSQGTSYPTISGDTILSMVGGTLKINNTIESKAGYGKILINGDTMNMTSSGAILGASYIYGAGSRFSAASGSKLKLGGVCRKATSSGTLSSVTYDKAITSPVSPFTGGC